MCTRHSDAHDLAGRCGRSLDTRARRCLARDASCQGVRSRVRPAQGPIGALAESVSRCRRHPQRRVDRPSRAWVGLLACTSRSALGGRSALAFDGFEGFTERGVTVVLPPGATRPTLQGVEPRFSAMLDERDVHPLHRPRRTRVARSLVDFASWQTFERRERAIVLSGVQQRITSTRHLRESLTRRGPCRHRALIIESILDAAGGVQSLPERDFDRIRVRRGLPEPSRQAIVRRPDGSYYLDATWHAYDTACEIHGVPHMLVPQWDADLLRSNEVTILGPRLLAFSSYAIRREQEVVGDQLERALRRGGWVG